MTAQIRGSVQSIVFASEESGFRVLRCIQESESAQKEEVTLVGVVPGVQVGETLEAHGQWEVSSKFGKQFRVQRFTVEPPQTKKGIEKYLSSGVLPGVGPGTRKKWWITSESRSSIFCDVPPSGSPRFPALEPEKHEKS